MTKKRLLDLLSDEIKIARGILSGENIVPTAMIIISQNLIYLIQRPKI